MIKRTVPLALAVTLLAAVVAAGAGAAAPSLTADMLSKPVTFNVKNAVLSDIFRLFGDMTGYNVLVAPGVEGRTITLALENVPVSQALENICRSQHLSYSVNPLDRLIRIGYDDSPAVHSLSEPVTGVFKPATLSEAARLLAQKTGWTFDVDPSVAGVTVDGSAKDAPVIDLLNACAERNGLCYVVDPSAHSVTIKSRGSCR